MTLAYSFSDEVGAIAELELAIVDHAQLAVALDAISKLQERSRVLQDGRRLKARGLLLLGNAGAGKSTIIELCAAKNPDEFTESGIVKRVLVVEVPARPTKRALVAAILNGMGYAASNRINAYDIIEDIALKATLLGIELIILDEAHHILESRDVHDVSEFLKSLLNKAGCGMVFAGLPILRELRSSPQFDRRLEPDINLRAYDWTSKAERLEFLTLLDKLEQECIRLPQPSNFADQDFARRLYLATRGEIGLVAKYLSKALQLAKKRGLERIDLHLLAEIDAAWHPSLTVANELSFDEDLSLEDDPDLESLIVDPEAVVIDHERNPFVCPATSLKKLWAERSMHLEHSSGQRTGRRAPGLGPGQPKAFEK